MCLQLARDRHFFLIFQVFSRIFHFFPLFSSKKHQIYPQKPFFSGFHHFPTNPHFNVRPLGTIQIGFFVFFPVFSSFFEFFRVFITFYYFLSLFSHFFSLKTTWKPLKTPFLVVSSISALIRTPTLLRVGPFVVTARPLKIQFYMTKKPFYDVFLNDIWSFSLYKL